MRARRSFPPAESLEHAIVALGHPARRELIKLCAGQERSAGELVEAVGLRQPTASQHLRTLRDAGLLVVRADGNLRLYQRAH